MHSICGLKHVQRVLKKSATLTLYKLHQTNTFLTSFQQCLRLQQVKRESYIEMVKIVTLISSDFDTSVHGRPRCTVFNSTLASASQWQSWAISAPARHVHAFTYFLFHQTLKPWRTSVRLCTCPRCICFILHYKSQQTWKAHEPLNSIHNLLFTFS